MIQVSSCWLKLLHLWREDVCYFQFNIKSHWKLNAGFPGRSFFCPLPPPLFFDWFGYFDKKIDCKERRGHDFSQPMVVVYAYDRHRGMRASCICSACNCSPNAQTNKKRCQQLREFYFILKHLLYTNQLTKIHIHNFFPTEKARKQQRTFLN